MLIDSKKKTIKEGSYWFKRFYRECKKMSPHLRFKRIKMGFYRIYYGQAYIHEVYKDMPPKGYDIETLDPRLESQSYYEQYEDNVELIRTVKNFVEGYYDSIQKIRVRLYQMRNDKEFNENARKAYRQIRIK